MAPRTADAYLPGPCPKVPGAGLLPTTIHVKFVFLDCNSQVDFVSLQPETKALLIFKTGLYGEKFLWEFHRISFAHKSQAKAVFHAMKSSREMGVEGMGNGR